MALHPKYFPKWFRGTAATAPLILDELSPFILIVPTIGGFQWVGSSFRSDVVGCRVISLLLKGFDGKYSRTKVIAKLIIDLGDEAWALKILFFCAFQMYHIMMAPTLKFWNLVVQIDNP